MDVSSAYGYPTHPALYQLAGASHALSGTGAITPDGTLATSVSQTINKGEYIYAANICSTANYTLCPKVLSRATGTSFQVTPGFSTAAEAMTVADPTICSTPIQFSGNADMAGLANPSLLNKPSSLQTALTLCNAACEETLNARMATNIALPGFRRTLTLPTTMCENTGQDGCGPHISSSSRN